MKGGSYSIAFFLPPNNSTLFKLCRGRICNLEHHITNFVLRPDNVSRCRIGAKSPPGCARDVFDFLSFSLIRKWKPGLAECKQFLRLGGFQFVFGVAGP